MAWYWNRVDWHDVRIAPDDIPDEDERVLVTVETLDGSRVTRADVFLKELENGDYIWYERACNENTHTYEDTILWYPVVAWAYYPNPYNR